MSADCAAASLLTRSLIRGSEILASSNSRSKPEVGRAAQLGAHAGRGDERLRRHAVPQHAGAADAVAVDDGDLGDVATAGRGDQCRLIAGGPAADDHDAGCHGLNLAKRAVDRPVTGRSLRAFSVPIYAAYGSNMHPEQMLQRAPHSPMAGTGWLHGWRLTFGGEDIGWEGALATAGRGSAVEGLRRALRHDRCRRGEPRPLGGRRAGRPQEDPLPRGPAVVGHRRPIPCWPGCMSSTRGRAACRLRAISA